MTKFDTINNDKASSSPGRESAVSMGFYELLVGDMILGGNRIYKFDSLVVWKRAEIEIGIDMTGRRNIVEDISKDIGAYLSEEERKCLLSDLHMACAWVGVKIPESIKVDRDVLEKEMAEHGLTEKDQPPEVHIEKGTFDLNELIWTLINKKDLTEKDRAEIEELIHVIESKERYDENQLKKMNLTHGEAKQIHEETTGIIRAILDLKDLLKNRDKSEIQEEMIRKKVEDTRKWQAYMTQIKDKEKYSN